MNTTLTEVGIWAWAKGEPGNNSLVPLPPPSTAHYEQHCDLPGIRTGKKTNGEDRGRVDSQDEPEISDKLPQLANAAPQGDRQQEKQSCAFAKSAKSDAGKRAAR